MIPSQHSLKYDGWVVVYQRLDGGKQPTYCSEFFLGPELPPIDYIGGYRVKLLYVYRASSSSY